MQPVIRFLVAPVNTTYSFDACGPLGYHTGKDRSNSCSQICGQPMLVLHTVNCTQWNVINSPSVLWNLLHPPRTWFNAHFGNINNILKTTRRCQMLTGGCTMKRINSDPILSLWNLRSLLECQSVVDVNSTGSIEGYPRNTLWFPLTKWH
jgi:hypothetical protein